MNEITYLKIITVEASRELRDRLEANTAEARRIKARLVLGDVPNTAEAHRRLARLRRENAGIPLALKALARIEQNPQGFFDTLHGRQTR